MHDKDMVEMDALIQRVEAATGPDRELDAMVRAAAERVSFVKMIGKSAFRTSGGDRGLYDTPAYTASLDAAVSLVPSGCLLVAMSDIAADGMPGVCLCSDTSASPPVEHWGISIAANRQAALALALCAAALRARLAMQMEGDG